MKVYCEDCEYARRIEYREYEWWRKNPEFATKSNAARKSFVDEVECEKVNKDNNCRGFLKKLSWWQKIQKIWKQ